MNVHSNTRVVFSMTPLVRFPWTPLEFEDAPGMHVYSRILSRTAGLVRAAGLEFRESADLEENWVSQVLVRADRPEFKEALLAAIEKTGFVYYRDVPEQFRSALEAELLARGITGTQALKGFTLDESATKPWVRVTTGVRREFLWEEFHRAKAYREIDYCLGRSWAKAQCFHCGGCPTRHHVRDIVLSKQERGYTLDQLKARVKAARESETVVAFRIKVGPRAQGLPRRMVGVALARAMMLADPVLRKAYRGYRSAFWADGDKEVWVRGDDVIELLWHRGAVERINAALRDSGWLARVNRELTHEWGELLGGAPAGWRPARLIISSFSSAAEPRPERYLDERSIKHTLRKVADGYSFEIAAQSARKGLLTAVTKKAARAGSFVCELSLGPKFNAEEAALFADLAGGDEIISAGPLSEKAKSSD